MKRGWMMGLLVCAGVWGSVVAEAATEVKVDGLVFAGYSAFLSQYNSTGAAMNDYNAFTVNRIYLGVSAKHSDAVSSRIVLESNSLAAGNATFLKMAYVEWKGGVPGLTVDAGLPGTSWRAFEEGLWRYRFVAKVLEDTEGILKPSDNGVRALYTFWDQQAVADVMVSNGEGFNALEVTRDKDVQGRLTLSPFGEALKGLSVTAFGLYGKANVDQRRERILAAVSYQSAAWFLTGMWLTAWDQAASGGPLTTRTGWSVYGGAEIATSWMVFGRVDGFDPDVDVASNARTSTVGGVSYECAEGVKVALSDRMVLQESEAAARKNQHVVGVDVVAKF